MINFGIIFYLYTVLTHMRKSYRAHFSPKICTREGLHTQASFHTRACLSHHALSSIKKDLKKKKQS